MKFVSKAILALTSSLALSSVSFADNYTPYQSVNEQGVYTLTAKQLLAQQEVDFIAWTQNSAEHRALSFQTYYLAKQAFDNAQVPAGTTKVVISDLDETLLDNSAYQAAAVLSGQGFSSKTWNKWEQSFDVKAFPGAVEFANYVNSHNGRMVYLSNRGDANKKACIEILKHLGFPGVNKDTVLLKGKTSDKNPRFEKAASVNDSKVVLWMGDNLYDFPNAYTNKTAKDRNTFVDNNKDLWGTRFIIFPNAMYGSWLKALYTGNGSIYALPATQQNQVHYDSLKYWADFGK